jgi:uncharacterized protein (TIGR03118 family)
MTRTTRYRPTVRPPARPQLEVLEDRCLLSGNVLQTNLVSDLPGVAQLQDPNLVNPWGISESSGSPFWISDNNAGVSTLYNDNPAHSPPVPLSINPLVVSIPTPTDLTGGTPTGTVFDIASGSNAFQITGPNKAGATTSAKAIFLFATEDGTIVGWNPGIDPTGKFAGPNGASEEAVIATDNSGNNFTQPDPTRQTGAVYKGLAIATSATPIFTGDASSTAVLYATNFRSGQVEVYDAAFTRVTLPTGAFIDPNLPQGFAPFNVQVLNNKVYVSYAKQNPTRHDDVAGPGNGFVDVYNLNGSGLQRLVTGGVLDSPWGLAIAPTTPTPFAGITAPNNDPVLLVGNFGNGFINAFDATNGTFLDSLKDPDGEPIQIDGLWALKVGNGGNGGDANAVYFTAGPFEETHGLFGSLTTAAPGSAEGLAESQAVTAALDVFKLALATVRKDLATGVTGSQLRQDLQALMTATADAVHAEVRFALDARDDLLPGRQRGDNSSGAVNRHGQDDLDSLFAGLGRLKKGLG